MVKSLLKKENKKLFKKDEVEWSLQMSSLLSGKMINRILKFLLHQLANQINYVQVLLLKILRTGGSSFGRLLGLGRPENKVRRLKEYLLHMSDGANLATDVYLPEQILKEKSKGPTILVRLPYYKDMMSIIGYVLASFGYIMVLQDVRGSAHSANYSTNSFMLHETRDGQETLRWIAKHFWYNGRIGMWGGSYFGLTQLAISEKNDGLLTCLNPSQCSYANLCYHPLGFFPLALATALYGLYNAITNSGVEGMLEMFGGDKEILERLIHQPLANLYNEPLNSTNQVLAWSELAQLKTPEEQVRLINERLGLELKANTKDTGQFSKLLNGLFIDKTIDINYEFFTHVLGFTYTPNVPMLMLGGLYDIFLEHNIYDIKRLQEVAPEYCKTQFKMVIGPYVHGGMDLGMSIPPSPPNPKILIQFLRHMLPMWWFEYWLKGEKKSFLKMPMLRIFILNRNIWRNFNAWPPKTTPMTLYLHSSGKANTRFGDGLLTTREPQDKSPDTYEFDPANPVVTKGGRHLTLGAGARNQLTREERSDVLVYSTEKLTEGIEIIGEVKLVFYASSTVKDTDFTAKLVDVFPNGRQAFNIIDNGVRARFRDGDLKNPSLLEPGKIYRYELTLGNTAIYFPKNHRIRLELSSSNYPRFDINSNLAGEQSTKPYIVAHQKIFHNSQNPSHLVLPIYKKT